jgi:TonB family protein
LQPPELVERAEAGYPPEALAQRLEARVVLRVTIDREGRVTEADVVEPAGHGFDEAARAAVVRSRFRPGMQGGKPVVVRILFPYDFELPAESKPAAESEPSASPQADADAAQSEPTVRPRTTPTPRKIENARVALPPVLPAESEPVEIKVAGERSKADKLQASAEAVIVVSTRKAKRETADLGEVLARTQGVAIRRAGGLGSETRFSLNGLYDDQIRFFLDGVPLDVAGYVRGVANVPVNLVERVEVYRGVVPIRFGADALGGAVHLVTEESYDTRATASYQVGSFGTHRFTAEGRYRHEPSGFILGSALFFDTTKNNYDVEVEIPDAVGRPQPATVPRFHDRYHAGRVMIEAGVVDRPWARRLTLRGFYSRYYKELQHNLVMKVPYGEVNYGEAVAGGTLRYDADLHRDVKLEVVASYSRNTTDYSDQSEWVYDWNGRRIRPRAVPGERDSRPRDQTIWRDDVFGRALLEWTIAPQHTVRAAATYAFNTRSGDERIQTNPNGRDPLTAERELSTFVSGVEYQLDLFDGKLSNVAFVKDYLYATRAEEPLPGGFFRRTNVDSHTQGVGDALRYRFNRWFYAKASYEYATRLPRPHEVFGDGVETLPNLQLRPELSHNANLGPRLELTGTALGDFTLDVNGFLRETRNLIVELPGERYSTYHNVYGARGFGIENAVVWSSPRRHVSLDGMLTWQDVRNSSSEGTFGERAGDRIPNRPYLFASFGARLRLEQVLDERDAVEPFYHGRYVHRFYRGWESAGLRESKQDVPSQFTHSAGVSWIVTRDAASVTSTFEVDNLTDAKVTDDYNVQRPGRAFHLKVTGEI